jgi:1-acyl-sn-glycerol-3-phosphate acyltransferase
MDWGDDVTQQDPVAVAKAVNRLSPLFRESGPYPCESVGLDTFPDAPVLMVSNHSGGVMIPDVWGLGYIWYSHFGAARPVHSLAHEIIFKIPKLGEMFARIGVLRASREVAHSCLLKHRHDLLVLPGGDKDVFRPYRDRFKVNFGGRKGYAKTALRAGVAIVPVANSGAHETLIVLRSGQRIAKALGLHALVRADVFPVSLSFPWGVAVGPLPNIPVPARFRYRFGAPIRIASEPIAEPTSAQVEELDALVRAALQGLLDELRDETPTIRQRLRQGLRS